jgi:predicted ATPase/DNA-binding CsgD family transcriptional regulator
MRHPSSDTFKVTMPSEQTQDTKPIAPEPLTQRELEILELYAAGYNNPEAAERLFLAESTIKWYARQIYGKLGVNDRESAVSKAYNLGFLVPEHTFDSLPVSLTPLIGRSDELRTVQRELLNPKCRLLTISGPGGIGKTRLAQQAALNLASRQSASLQDGIYFVPLTPISSLTTAIASALKSDSSGGYESQYQQILAYLRRKRLLILLDNFGTFVGSPDAAWLVELLTAARGVKLLVTSQIRLDLPGEQVFPLGGLEFPLEEEISIEQGNDYGSIKLFLHAARRTQPDFRLTPKNLEAVVRICRLLEGSPLGIELAAAWSGILSPPEIQAEVETSLDFLATSKQAVPDRQRSLRAVFTSSWEMLDDAGRAAAKRLAAFQGGFDISTAQQIAGLSPQDLMNLVNKSWIQRDSSDRFLFYDSLKKYVEEIATKEAGWDVICQEHSAYFCALAGRQGLRLHSAEFREACEQLRAEQDNLRAAWYWAVRRHSWDLVAQAMPGIGAYLKLYGPFSEGEELCSLAAAEILESSSQRDDCLPAHLLGWQAVFTRDPEVAARLLEQAQAFLERAPKRDEPDCRRVQAFIWHQTGQMVAWKDRTRAIGLFEQSLECYQKLGDEQSAAELMTALGEANRMIMKVDAAQSWLETALKIQNRIGDFFFAAKSLNSLGLLATGYGSFKKAKQLHEESLAYYHMLGSHLGLADILFVMAYSLSWNGEWEKAEQHARESIVEFALTGYEGPFLATAYLALAYVLIARGKYSRARLAALEGLSLARKYGNLQQIAIANLELGRLDLMDGQYGPAYQNFTESFRVFSELQHRVMVPSLAYLAVLCLNRDEPRRAYRELNHAIGLAVEYGDIQTAIAVLPPVILYLNRAGHSELAFELFRFARLFPDWKDHRWFLELCGTELEAQGERQPADESGRLSEAERAGLVMEKLKQLRSKPLEVV